MKVIIIGAGIAGITAALTLQNNGIDVLILEARGRIGGRITKAEEFSDIPVDLGASWIHGVNGNPLFEIAQKMNIKMDVTDNPSLTSENCFDIYDEDGKEFDSEVEKKVRHKFEEMSRVGRKLLEEGGNDLPLEYVLAMNGEEERMSPKEWKLLNWMKSGIEGWENTNLSNLSARGHFWENENQFTGGDGFVVDGFHKIIDFLAKPLLKEHKILLSQEVLSVEYFSDGVRVNTSKGTFEGDYCICTLPLGVLKSKTVEFSPNFPEWKEQALDKLGFGLMNKIVLEFPELFWNKDKEGFAYVASQRGEFNFFMNLYPLLKRPILMCFVAADFARLAEHWSDNQIVNRIMNTMNKIFKNGKVKRPIKTKITRWGNDPFARGSYSYLAYGSTLADVEAYATPIERLHFAGEATFKPIGFAHGAYLSGIREAQLIIHKSKMDKRRKLVEQEQGFPIPVAVSANSTSAKPLMAKL